MKSLVRDTDSCFEKSTSRFPVRGGKSEKMSDILQVTHVLPLQVSKEDDGGEMMKRAWRSSPVPEGGTIVRAVGGKAARAYCEKQISAIAITFTRNVS